MRPPLLSDLTRDLRWPRALRAAGLAMRPQRWVFSCVLLVVLLLGIRLADSTAPGRSLFSSFTVAAGRAIDEVTLECTRGDLPAIAAATGRSIRSLLVDTPLSRPLTTLAVLLPLLAIWSVGATALARMNAVEFGHGSPAPWTEALAIALRRWSSSMAALLVAPIGAGLICLGMAAAGWVLLGIPYVEAAGSLTYPLLLAGGLVSVLLLVGHGLGKHLICPAVACEGSDALDAFQRSMAYVVASPGRFLVYAALGTLQTALFGVVVWFIATWTSDLAVFASHAWVSPLGPGEEPGWSRRFADSVTGLCLSVPMLAVAGYALSAYVSVSTITYLLLREHNDGQDPSDLWQPGMIEGTLAAAPPLAAS
ncbi:MAG: hypothetical protein KF787_06405 [Phycisphaeraceae bacterium]|nr:hypothetical protein [Phycisphaerae bacterium]MBX3392263.1 hypothetical protein [Phycisphaeraceae bacterium]HRJ49218.1 hypothetical protein [Phycisphaerales bacterium]